jgi:hypothetical protein
MQVDSIVSCTRWLEYILEFFWYESFATAGAVHLVQSRNQG